jgi:hypothetical protein
MSNLDEPETRLKLKLTAFHASQSMVRVAASLIRAMLHLAPLEASRVSW